MDLLTIEKSSTMLPALVRLYDGHRLYELARDKKPLARAELSNAVTELLEINENPQEAELIADVLISLMRQAERDLRSALSEKLSGLPNVPLRLALHIANEEIEIAQPFLSNSSVLNDLDLIYIIKSKGAEYWRAIAQRKEMSDQIINVLATTKDNETAQNLAGNSNIVLPKAAMEIIADMALQSESIAKPLVQRREIPSELIAKIYSYVGTELKNFILQNHQLDTDALLNTVDEAVVEFVEENNATPFSPAPSMVKAAHRHKDQGILTIQMILGTLRRGQMQRFVAQFAAYCNLKPKIVEKVMQQKNGQGLAVICKAVEIQKADFLTIFLLTNRMRDDGRYVDSVEMQKAIKYFQRVEVDVARRLLRSSQKG